MVQLHLLIFAASSSSSLTATVVLDFRGQTTHGRVLSWEGDVSGSDSWPPSLAAGS